MKTDEILEELNLIYTIGSACKWWDDQMTEALSEAADAVRTEPLLLANVNIQKSLLQRGKP